MNTVISIISNRNVGVRNLPDPLLMLGSVVPDCTASYIGLLKSVFLLLSVSRL